MDTVYGTKKYFQSLSGASDIYRSPACRAVSNDYTYQNTLGRRSTLGAYYHMNNQPSYSNDLSINNQYGYNTWGIWRDGRNVAPSTFSAKPHAHYQKTRSFSIILTTAAFIVLLAVISIAGLAFYFSSIKGNMEDPVLGFEGSFRIAKGDLFSTGLKYNHTTSYKQKIEFYKRFVERSLTDQGLVPLRTDVWGFGEGPLIKVNFRTFFDVRKLPQNIHSVEEYIKEALFLETTAVKSLYRSLRIDADSVEIKRILDEQVVKSASLFKDAHAVPTSQTQLEKRLMKKGGNAPALINKPSSASSTKGRSTAKPHSPDDEPDIDVENAPVIQGSFEGSFEITKTDADIARKKTTPTRAYTLGSSMAPKAVTPYALRVKPKKPGIEKLTTIVPETQPATIIATTKAAMKTTKATTTSTTSTTTTTEATTTTTTPATTTTTLATTTSTTTTTPKPTTTTLGTSSSTTSTSTTNIPTSPSYSSTSNDMPPAAPHNHFNYPSLSAPSAPPHLLPKLDQNLFTSVPILDTQPWRPIHREVPEFLPGPPPSFPTKTLPTIQMPVVSTSLPPLMPPVPAVNEEPPRRRIDEFELPFLPEEPRPPQPALDSYTPNFYGPAFRKPDMSMEMKNPQDLTFYHSFGNPVFMPGSEGIERLGAGASVQPHPLPVQLIDDVVIPPFKPLNPNLPFQDELPFDLESVNEKFEHLGGGVIAKKQENTTSIPEAEVATVVSSPKQESTEQVLEQNKETSSSSTARPKDEMVDSTSATSELADKIGEFFMDLLDLPKDDVNGNKEQLLESRIEPEEDDESYTLPSKPQREETSQITMKLKEQETTESTTAPAVISSTSKPNFLNLKELILQRNQLHQQNLKKPESQEENSKTKFVTTSLPATAESTTSSTTTTTTTSARTPTSSRPVATTTTRSRVQPSHSRPLTMFDDSTLFPSNSKWKFANGTTSSQAGHTGNMRKVFNTTLQAWVSEDVEKTENFTLNDLKTKINNATNIQDISLIFDTLASKLGITPSQQTKVPPFSHNKMKNTQKNESRGKPSSISSSRTTATTFRTTARTTYTTTTNAPLPETSSTQRTTPTPYMDIVFERREPFIKPMSSFMEDTSSEGFGAALPVVGEAEVEVIDPTKYEEMLKSSQFADSTTTETTPKLVTLLPVRSNSGIRTYKPFGDSGRSNAASVAATTSSTYTTSTSSSSNTNSNSSSSEELVDSTSSSSSSSVSSARSSSSLPVYSTTSSSSSSSSSFSKPKSGLVTAKSGSPSRPNITRRKHVSQSRRFPPPEAVIRGGLKVTVK